MSSSPRAPRRRFKLRRTVVLWPLAASLPLLPLGLRADGLPAGGQVRAGQATINAPAGGKLVVDQASRRAVLRWSDFSIGAGREVTFRQPVPGAQVLNIVNGPQASTLAGKLTADGAVLLVNPQGIRVTPTGQVNARGGFIASTLGLEEADFMAGRLLFAGQGGSVVNQGSIAAGTGGTIALIGSTVANEGLISAPLGKVMLGSGSRATLDLSGDGFLQVALPADAVGADGQPLVKQSGTIQAVGGTVLLTAASVRSAVREAVHMPGTISARSVAGHDGAIVLQAQGRVSVSGRLDASADAGNGGTKGGRIDIAGEAVSLQGATVLATGGVRGGVVRIGGGYQGAAPDIANAATTSIDAASGIDVSSAAGTGGTAVVWSEQNTSMQGSLKATGPVSGGAVEISSASRLQNLALSRVEVGRGGKLLLDPQDIVIDGAGTEPAAGGNSHIAHADLVAQLAAGTSVSLLASNDIAWFAPFPGVQMGGPTGDLRLEAGRSVLLNGIFTTGQNNWTLVANSANPAVVPAERQAGAGHIDLSNAQFTNDNGNLSLRIEDGGGAPGRFAGDISLSIFQGNSLSASISPTALTEFGGPARIGFYGQVRAAGDVSLSAGRMVINEDITSGGALTFTGNLQSQGFNRVFSARSIAWTDEATATIRGEGQVRFVEDGRLVRYGNLSGADATRLALRDDLPAASRVYGDADPGESALTASPFEVTSPGAMNLPAPDLSALAPGSMQLTGPGAMAQVGTHSATLSAHAQQFGLAQSGYFVDTRPVAMPLQITPRTVTATGQNASYVYGSPTTAATLNNVVNGDAIVPVATLNGTPGSVLQPDGMGGFRFAPRTDAGTWAFTVTGVTGDRSGNYVFAPAPGDGGTLTIARKPITYAMPFGAGGTYGDASYVGSVDLAGVLEGDVGQVRELVNLTTASGPAVTVPFGSTVRPGDYIASVGGLTGSRAGNYEIAAAGNTSRAYTLARKPITFFVGDTSYVYGSAVAPGAAALAGVINGDDVTGMVSTVLGTTPVTIVPRLGVGAYSQFVDETTGLAGADAGNYVLSVQHSRPGTMFVQPKPLTYAGASGNLVYGPTQTDLRPALQGILAGDDVVSFGDWRQDGGPLLRGSGSGALPVGTYGFGYSTLFGADAANYRIDATSSSDLNVRITPRPVTYRYDATSSTYLDMPVPTGGFTGLLAGDSVNGAYVATFGGGEVQLHSRSPATAYRIEGRLAGSDAGNYMVDQGASTAGMHTVLRRPVTVTVSDFAGTYGDARRGGALPNMASLSHGEFEGLQAVLDLASGPFTQAYLPVGSYGVMANALTGAAAANYVFAGSNTANLSLARKPVTWRAPSQLADLEYGDTAALLTHARFGTFDGTLPGDVVQGTYAITNYATGEAATNRSPVGRYRANFQGVANPNYIGSGSPELTIFVLPRTIGATGATGSRIYGDASALPAGMLDTSRIVPGDNVFAGTSLFRADPTRSGSGHIAVGNYLTYVNALAGPDASNYRLSGSADGVLSVLRKPVSFSLGVSAGGLLQPGTIEYGDLPRGANGYFQPVGEGVFAGAFAGDDLGVTSVAPRLSYGSSGHLGVGTYRWTTQAYTGADRDNYTITAGGSSVATLTVAPRRIEGAPGTVNGAPTADHPDWMPRAVYGTTGQYRTGFYPSEQTPFLQGDMVDARTAVAGYLGTLPQRLPVGDYPIVFHSFMGADAANYTFAGTGNTFTVTPRPVTFSIADQRVVYGNTLALAAQAHGLLPGDDAGLIPYINANGRSWSTVYGNGVNVGNYENHVRLVGSAAGNYQLQGNPATGTFTRVDWRPVTYVPGMAASSVYGTRLAEGSLQDVVAGDDLGIVTSTVGSSGRLAVGDLLDAGQYNFGFAFTGTSAGNYILAPGVRSFAITPKRIGSVTAARNAVYGTAASAPSVTLLDLVAGGKAVGANTVTIDARGNTVPVNERTDAGTYQTRASTLTGPGAGNYILDPAQQVSGTLAIAPKALTVRADSPGVLTYGTAPRLATIDGVLFGDDVTISSIATPGLPASVLSRDANDGLTYGVRTDVGTYAYTTGTTTSGAKAGNYTVANSVSGQFTLVPKEVVYTVGNGSGQWGNFRACDPATGCYPWTPGMELGHVTLAGALAGDDVGGDVLLIDGQGRSGKPDASTPIGMYAQIVTGLTGAKAGNYRLAAYGHQGGVYEVTPVWMSYATSSALYLPEAGGLVGKPGVATLRSGGTGGLIGGRGDVQAVVAWTGPDLRPVTDLSTLNEGTYRSRVVGFYGPDAGYYRLLPDNLRNGGAYALNDPGTLTVFGSSKLGLGLVDGGSVAKPPPVAPPPAQSVAPDVTSKEWGSKISELPEYGRNIDATGADTAMVIGSTGVRASAGAAGVVTADVDVGPANLSGQASGSVDAMARVGPTGITLQANANAHADVTVRLGDAYLTYGAQADGQLTAKLGRNGAQLSAEARAAAYEQLGIDTSISDVGDLSASGTTAGFATASAEGRMTYEDGRLVQRLETEIGVGLSAGGAFGLSGSAGRVDAGATVYSPGSLGAAVNWSGGYSDGMLSLGIDIGAKIGLGGLQIKLDVAIDVSTPVAMFTDIGNSFMASFGPRPRPPAPDNWDYAVYRAHQLAKDPVARYAYLKLNPTATERKKGQEHNDQEAISNANFLRNYERVVSDANALLNDQRNAQQQLLALLKTDPQKAIEMTHSGVFANLASRQRMVLSNANSVGVKLQVHNGTVGLVNK